MTSLLSKRPKNCGSITASVRNVSLLSTQTATGHYASYSEKFGAFFSRLKRPGREAQLSNLPSGEDGTA